MDDKLYVQYDVMYGVKPLGRGDGFLMRNEGYEPPPSRPLRLNLNAYQRRQIRRIMRRHGWDHRKTNDAIKTLAKKRRW